MYKQWAGICTNKRICFSYKLLIAWPWVKESLKMQHIPASLASCPKKKPPKDWRSRGISPGCKTTPCHRILISVFRFLHPADKKKSFSTYIGLLAYIRRARTGQLLQLQKGNIEKIFQWVQCSRAHHSDPSWSWNLAFFIWRPRR